ncbi:MAG TPA: hypothetical protein VK812_21535 [Candidatus Binatus sp.]|nr:hypothetical protein [Candidatus Binatus sp.]
MPEPKIDSREFEVANLDQHTGGWSGGASGDSTDIAIRIWGADRGVGLTWRSESVLVCMIADLVGASRGQIAEESPAVMAAHFDNSRQAVVAAKRIQMAMLEFAACRPGEGVGSAIVIYQPRTSESTGLSGEMVQMELGQAKPGQILLAENIAQGLRDLPGIELVAPSALGASADSPAGLPELVWTTPERLAGLRESVGVARSVEGPPVGATLIMDSPYARREASNDAALNEAVPTVMGGDNFAVRDRTADRTSDQSADRGAIAGNFRESTGSSLAGMEFEEEPLFTRTRVLLGVVAVVLVGVVIAVLFRPTNVSKRVAPQPQEQTGTAQTADQKTSGTASPPAEPEVQKPAESTTVQAPGKPVVVTPPPNSKTADNRAKKKKDAVTKTQEVPEVPSEVGGMTAKDIPELIKLAKVHAGAGLYDKARREFQTVLTLQPGNAEAVEGLRKIRIAVEGKEQ